MNSMIFNSVTSITVESSQLRDVDKFPQNLAPPSGTHESIDNQSDLQNLLLSGSSRSRDMTIFSKEIYD